jgi:hypothetical protein
MSREIDVDNFTSEDEAYMRDRPWLIAEFEFNNPDITFEEFVAGAGVEDEEDYNSLTKDDLVKLLKERGLEVSGKKDELVARLEENDAEQGNQA